MDLNGFIFLDMAIDPSNLIVTQECITEFDSPAVPASLGRMTINGEPTSVIVSDSIRSGSYQSPELYLDLANIMIKMKPHPCIQKIYGYNLSKFSFITEMVDHTFLTYLFALYDENESGFLDLNEFTPTGKSIFAYALACALMHLHANNITHRNINPMTVSIDQQFLPKIHIIHSLVRPPNHLRGMITFPENNLVIFDAPETFGTKSFDSKVDVYSYGMILQALVTDWIPYVGNKRPQRLSDIREYFVQREICSGTRPELVKEPYYNKINTIIRSCWELDPEKRPTFADIVHDLNNYGPLFPDTDLVEYEEVTRPIFCKSVIPEKDQARFN